MIKLQPWVIAALAHPVSKQPCKLEAFNVAHGVIDARVFLKNTHGYKEWEEGQEYFENEYSEKNTTTTEDYHAEISYDRPIYERYQMAGRILDCGGGAGTVREFLSDSIEFVSTDPWLRAPLANSAARKAAYTCLNRSLNFIAATAEFQPFIAESFDWVHMRSMLDHVQVADLALLEANRVLKPDGRILIGLYVDGGKSGIVAPRRRFEEFVMRGLKFVGIDQSKDHHTWHPTYENLLKLISGNGFVIEDTYWQPHWKDTVCYVCAQKSR